jgi:hypothetical protein
LKVVGSGHWDYLPLTCLDVDFVGVATTELENGPPNQITFGYSIFNPKSIGDNRKSSITLAFNASTNCILRVHTDNIRLTPIKAPQTNQHLNHCYNNS